MKPTIFIIVFLVFFPLYCAAQNPREDVFPMELNTKVQNCEISLLYQDMVVTFGQKFLTDGRILIVVSRLGDGEYSNVLNQRRIYNVETYLRTRGHLADDKFLVTAGPRAHGLGRLEYYLNGKLAQQLFFRKNGYICHSCCGPDELYYPEKLVHDRQQQKTTIKRARRKAR